MQLDRNVNISTGTNSVMACKVIIILLLEPSNDFKYLVLSISSLSLLTYFRFGDETTKMLLKLGFARVNL